MKGRLFLKMSMAFSIAVVGAQSTTTNTPDVVPGTATNAAPVVTTTNAPDVAPGTATNAAPVVAPGAAAVTPDNTECCGPTCQVESDSLAPGCSDEYQVHHGGADVTQADTMPVESIARNGYHHMFNTSCASSFGRHSSELHMSTWVYDCGGLCNEREYGRPIFDECCSQCSQARADGVREDRPLGPFLFYFCKGCPVPADPAATPPVPAGEPETELEFKSRLRSQLESLVVRMRQRIEEGGGEEQGQDVYGSRHDGAWHTELDAGQGLNALGAQSDPSRVEPIPRAFSPSINADYADTPARHLQNTHMFSNSYGYNTRCAVATPAPCNGTYLYQKVDCRDCAGVPVLGRACCRDCGCELIRRAESVRNTFGGQVHLECLGCSCDNVVDERSLQEWVDRYVDSCHPVSNPQNESASCCGADCEIEGQARECSQEIVGRTIHHGDAVVTQADTMSMETIHHTGFRDMFNASCASGFDRDVSSLDVRSWRYECDELCPVADYGQAIFDACCDECERKQEFGVGGTFTFSFCKGCPRRPQVDGVLHGSGYNRSADAAGIIEGCNERTEACGWLPAESEQDFEARMRGRLQNQIGSWQAQREGQNPHYGDEVYGSVHDGAWHTDLDDSGNPLNTAPLQDARSRTGARPLAPSRRLQHMFDRSFGYNTRCAAALPRPCNGTFQVKLIDCNDCSNVPILQRACCRDCGCQLEREIARNANSDNFLHLSCEGCSCNEQDRGLDTWVAAFIARCSESQPNTEPLAAAVSARYYVHGSIPLHFQDTNQILTNPTAAVAVAEAILEIAGAGVTPAIPVSAVHVTFNNSATRRLEDSQRRLTGVINANFMIEVQSPDSARRAEQNVEGETAGAARAVINRHLAEHQLETTASVDSFVTSAANAPVVNAPLLTAPAPGPTTRQSTAVQASPPPATSSTSGAWLPAVLGIAVALGVAVFAVVIFLNSSKPAAKKNTPKKGRGLSSNGRALSPRGQNSNAPAAQPAQTPTVQPTISTVLPMATPLQPSILAPRLQPAVAVAVPQQPMMSSVIFSR